MSGACGRMRNGGMDDRAGGCHLCAELGANRSTDPIVSFGIGIGAADNLHATQRAAAEMTNVSWMIARVDLSA